MKQGWQKKCLKLLGSFSLTYVCVAIIFGLVVSKFFLPKVQAVNKDVQSFHGEILSDLRFLDAKPIFADSPRKKDAQDFISNYIDWEGAQAGSVPLKQAELIALKANYPKIGDVESLRKIANDPRTEKIDVSWVDQLESYDHWNLASSSIVKAEFERLKKLNGIERMGVLAKMPIPGFVLLQFASIVRFLQLQKSGDPIKGLRLMRQASYLADTTHSLIGAMIAVAGLGYEHKLIDTFNIRDWTTIEKERIAAYKRVSWAWGGLIHQASWDTLPEEFQILMKPRNGVCGMASEIAFASLPLRDFLAPTVPLETNFSAQLQKSENIARKLFEVCATPEYLALLEPSPANSNPLLVRIPFVRRGLGLTLLAVGTPRYLQQYKTRNPAANAQEAKPEK